MRRWFARIRYDDRKRGDLGPQARFLAQSVLLEEAAPPRLVRLGMALMAGAVIAFVGWTAVARINSTVKGVGQVVPSGSVLAIQHLEGGIVADILVRDGDIVERGMPLVRLDPTATRAQLEEAEARMTALELRAERLQSFADGRPIRNGAVDARFRDLAANQEAILRLRNETRDSKRAVLEQQIAQRAAELAVLVGQEETLKKRIGFLSEQLAMRETLVEKGLVSRLVYIGNLQDLNTAQGDLVRVSKSMGAARAAIAEARGRLAEAEAEVRNDAVSELGDVSAEIARTRSMIARLQDQYNRLDIAAPVRGVVKGLRINTLGGVIPPGGLVTEIVPLGRDLVVEAKLAPRDIGHIHPGQRATVKVTTYDFARLGGIEGTVETVSATTFDAEHGEKYFRGIVQLARAHVGPDPARHPILPGMQVEVDIQTGSRTLLQYLIRPAYEQLHHAFTER